MIGESIRYDERQQNTDPKDRTIVTAISGPQFPTMQVLNPIKVKELAPNFASGKPSSGVWEKLGNNDEAKVGDTLRMTFTMGVPYFQDWQRDFIVWKLNQDSRFILNSVQLNEELRRLVVEVELKKDFSPAFLVPIVIIGLLAGALIIATTVSIERLSTVKIGDLEFKGTPFIVLAILGASIFFVLRRA